MIQILIIIIFTILLLLIYIYNSRINYEQKYKNRIFSSKYNHEFKSGDIIFMNYPYGAPFINYAVDSYFQHVGIVVRYNDELYILETGIDGAFYLNSPDGINMNKIPDIFKRNNNDYYVLSINKELDYDRNNKILEILKSNYSYPNYSNLLLNYLINNNNPENDKHCFDLLAIILNEINFVNIIDKPIDEKAYIIEHLHKINLSDDYKYDLVKKLIS